MQAQDVFARLAAALATDGDLHALLVRLLEPIARLSQARAASVSVAEGGRLRQLGALELASAPAGHEHLRAVAERAPHGTREDAIVMARGVD